MSVSAEQDFQVVTLECWGRSRTAVCGTGRVLPPAADQLLLPLKLSCDFLMNF